jgi:hypothetical protein
MDPRQTAFSSRLVSRQSVRCDTRHVTCGIASRGNPLCAHCVRWFISELSQDSVEIRHGMTNTYTLTVTNSSYAMDLDKHVSVSQVTDELSAGARTSGPLLRLSLVSGLVCS